MIISSKKEEPEGDDVKRSNSFKDNMRYQFQTLDSNPLQEFIDNELLSSPVNKPLTEVEMDFEEVSVVQTKKKEEKDVNFNPYLVEEMDNEKPKTPSKKEGIKNKLKAGILNIATKAQE